MSYVRINNKKNRRQFVNQNCPRLAQQGVVLFFALIALVVMSLAAVALIRSVDTNSQITGNLSFRQSATISSSYGLEAVADTLGVQPYANANTSTPANGYYAYCKKFDDATSGDCNGKKLTLDASWVPGTTSNFASGLGISAGGVDAYGNTIQYIVERMCNDALGGSPVRSKCILATSDPQNGSFAIKNEPQADRPDGLADSPIYRVTVRVAGPKNTVTYIQSFISAHS